LNVLKNAAGDETSERDGLEFAQWLCGFSSAGAPFFSLLIDRGRQELRSTEACLSPRGREQLAGPGG